MLRDKDFSKDYYNPYKFKGITNVIDDIILKSFKILDDIYTERYITEKGTMSRYRRYRDAPKMDILQSIDNPVVEFIVFHIVEYITDNPVETISDYRRTRNKILPDVLTHVRWYNNRNFMVIIMKAHKGSNLRYDKYQDIFIIADDFKTISVKNMIAGSHQNGSPYYNMPPYQLKYIKDFIDSCITLEQAKKEV